jgi:seryl-tRNA synthetase
LAARFDNGSFRSYAEATAMASLSNDQRELHDALEAFETALNTPVVSGELEDWTTALASAWRALRGAVEDQLQGPHHAQLKEIGKQDPELLPRVEQLKQEDQGIDRQLGELSERIDRLSAKAPQIEPNEGKADDERTRVMSDGVAFINRVRKQEVGIQTWFLEAFNRDLGVGD